MCVHPHYLMPWFSLFYCLIISHTAGCTLLAALVQARAMSPPRLLLVSRVLQETLHCQSLNVLPFTLQGKSSFRSQAPSRRATLLTSCKREGEAVRGYYCPNQTPNSNMWRFKGKTQIASPQHAGHLLENKAVIFLSCRPTLLTHPSHHSSSFKETPMHRIDGNPRLTFRASTLSHSHSSMPYSHFNSSTPTLKFLPSESLSFLVKTSLPKSPIHVSLSPPQSETRAKFQEIYLALCFRLVVMRCWIPYLTKTMVKPIALIRTCRKTSLSSTTVPATKEKW